MHRLTPLLVATCLSAACAPEEQIIPLVRSSGLPATDIAPKATPLTVTTRATSVEDPLRVRGTDVRYSEIEPAMASAVATALEPWAASHVAARPTGWAMLVELTQADADYKDGRLRVTLAVRATLRARADNAYLAQTQAHCQEAGLVAPERGADVLFRCVAHIGRELSGFMGGVDP